MSLDTYPVAYVEAMQSRLAELEAENKALRERNSKLEDCIETAWGIIANAGGGNWDNESQEWKKAAESWRDNQFHHISTVREKVEGGTR